jgi:hypothetical protein
MKARTRPRSSATSGVIPSTATASHPHNLPRRYRRSRQPSDRRGVRRRIHLLGGERRFFGGVEQAPGCINVLDVDEAGGFVVRAVNLAPLDPVHLAGRATTMEELWASYRRGADPRRPS